MTLLRLPAAVGRCFRSQKHASPDVAKHRARALAGGAWARLSQRTLLNTEDSRGACASTENISTARRRAAEPSLER